MAKIEDYGIHFLSHGEWSDPEIRFEKSDYQKVLFNYWDVVECTDYEELCNSTEDSDLQELAAQLGNLTPSEYERPHIDYEWEIIDGNVYDSYDDHDYFKDAKLSRKEDFVLHTTGQALRQALQAIDFLGETSAEICIYRNEGYDRCLVANYEFQGSTLKDIMHYGK